MRLLLTIATLLLLTGCTQIAATYTLPTGEILTVDYETFLQNKRARVIPTQRGLEVEYNTSSDPAVEMIRIMGQRMDALEAMLRAGAAAP